MRDTETESFALSQRVPRGVCRVSMSRSNLTVAPTSRREICRKSVVIEHSAPNVVVYISLYVHLYWYLFHIVDKGRWTHEATKFGLDD